MHIISHVTDRAFFSKPGSGIFFLHFDYVQAILLPLFFIYFHRSFFFRPRTI